jgi:hypothetical protein
MIGLEGGNLFTNQFDRAVAAPSRTYSAAVQCPPCGAPTFTTRDRQLKENSISFFRAWGIRSTAS